MIQYSYTLGVNVTNISSNHTCSFETTEVGICKEYQLFLLEYTNFYISFTLFITRGISSSYCELIFNEVYIVEIHMTSYHNVLSTNTPIAKYTNHETVSLSILHNAHKDRNDFYTQ